MATMNTEYVAIVVQRELTETGIRGLLGEALFSYRVAIEMEALPVVLAEVSKIRGRVAHGSRTIHIPERIVEAAPVHEAVGCCIGALVVRAEDGPHEDELRVPKATVKILPPGLGEKHDVTIEHQDQLGPGIEVLMSKPKPCRV
jgi:hypothetical protein